MINLREREAKQHAYALWYTRNIRHFIIFIFKIKEIVWLQNVGTTNINSTLLQLWQVSTLSVNKSGKKLNF